MLGSFKTRLLIVIVIATLAGLAMQSNNGSREVVEPVIAYVLKDYGVEKKIATFVHNVRDDRSIISVSGTAAMQLPCEYQELTQRYGWYWDEEEEKQRFYPGLSLKVDENTLVKPVMAGEVIEISQDSTGRTVLMQHDDEVCSLYGGLKEVLVEENTRVELEDALGKSGSSLYLEMRNQDGPLNVNYLFE
jgi:murein DD-endopeptidase MepM/ murein hydrolase activator NlpD